MVEPASFLASDLKKSDPDRYLLSLFAPAAVRPALWVLFLFNHELVRNRSMVSETRLGLIRLQWWRDELTKIYDGGAGGQIPILSTLAPLIHNGTLPFEYFEALLYAREFDLEDVAPANFEGLKNYCDFTTTPLSRLALKIVGESANDDEIRQISTNFGLFEAIRNVPLLLSQGRCLLPQDMLNEKNLTSKKIIDFNYKTEIVEILQLMHAKIESYRKPDSAYLSRMQRMTFIYLDRFEKNGMNVFMPIMQTPPPFLALRMMF